MSWPVLSRLHCEVEIVDVVFARITEAMHNVADELVLVPIYAEVLFQPQRDSGQIEGVAGHPELVNIDWAFDVLERNLLVGELHN